MKIGFVSLGCSKNLVDSEKMMGMIQSSKHEIVANPAQADAIIINTCGFINSAKEEAIDTIFEMAKYKQKQLKKLIVVGCLAQRYKQTLIEEIPEIDAVIPIAEYDHLHEILRLHLDGYDLQSYSKSERLISSKPWTAYLKIAEGCSNNCTYCAIPLIRGGNRSYPMEELIEQAKQLAKKGVKELVLIAQDTTKYGLDLYQKYALLDLLEKLNTIEEFHWIRILYMYPDEITEELVKGMSKLSKVLPYFDIPMQHANDEMLKKMNRRGTQKEIRDLIMMIRSYYPHATLRTTFILGFPSETEAQFEELLAFVKDIKWNRMGAFPYSKEEDTAAYHMKEEVAEEVKHQRVQQLMQLQEKISYENQMAKIGTTIEVLVESQEGLMGKYRGRSHDSAPDGVDGMVIFTSDRAIPFGTFVKVKIQEANAHDVFGVEVIDERI